jgi:NAD(P)-dependent dehydrogenase (short-subunit alcohol dehydrogenase family)
MSAVDGNDSGQSRVVLVTGGSTGIGAATVAGLLARGHRVVATGRDEAKLDLLAKRLDDERLVTASGDGAVQSDVEAAVRVATDTFGGLDVVVANAGFSTHDTLADGDPEAWRQMVLINVLGPMLLIRAALPALRRSDAPRVVLLGSVAGVKNSPGNVYSVTKWAVTGLAENARMLLTRDGIGVTMVAPGRVETPF